MPRPRNSWMASVSAQPTITLVGEGFGCSSAVRDTERCIGIAYASRRITYVGSVRKMNDCS